MNRRHLLTALGATALLPHALKAAAGPGELAADIDIMRDCLALHCGLYRYASRGEVNARLAALRATFAASRSLEERYLLLSRFTATIRDGHTYCNFFNQKRAVAAQLFDRPTRVPFHFRWLGGQMVVTAHGGPLLPPGTVIERLNGTAPAAMFAALLPYVRTDGHNEGKKRALLEVHGTENIETFDVFQGLLFPPTDARHAVIARTPAGVRVATSLPVVTLAQRRTQMVARESDDGPIWTWTRRPDGVVVLDMPSWALYNSKWDWRGWLAERLDTLRDACGLIIDLRGNEGGNDCGAPILARLIARRLHRDSGERWVRFRRTPPALDRYLDTWDDSFRTLGIDAVDLGNGFYRKPPVAGVDWIDPVGPRIARPVAALVGPTCSSATFQFASLVKRSGVVRLFGATTGGNRKGTIGGGFFFVRLPASGIEFDLPLIGYVPRGPRPDGGVEPDVRVAPTPADIAAARDPAMAAATAWVLRERNRNSIT